VAVVRSCHPKRPGRRSLLAPLPRDQVPVPVPGLPGSHPATLDASPWGLTDPVFAPFTQAHPVSTVAALTAYWVAHTQALLTFERAHPQACLRIQFEQLTEARPQTEEAIMSFIGVTTPDGQAAPTPDRQTQPESGTAVREPEYPAGLIPAAMRARANDLLRQLGYSVLPAAPAG
jgi:hypothetical protein